MEIVWQDREIRFDVKPTLLNCRRGEEVIDSINSVEDTKGNNGARGSMLVTNLRLIWICHADPRVNLSIGHNTIIAANIRKAKSKLKGTTQALCVMAKFSSRYEFVFTSLVKNSPRLFTTVQTVMRAYETSNLYRELKLRGSILKDGEVMLLPLEKVFSKHDGVWNLSSEQGNLGTMYVTNIRVIWHANLAVNFNVSLPYIQIKNIILRNSKFGKALVIETMTRAGGYILGFRVDPMDRLNSLYKELTSLFTAYRSNPIFGVEYTVEAETPELNELVKPRVEEDVEVEDNVEDNHAVATYLAEEEEELDDNEVQSPFFDARLGLSVERLPGEATTESLWRVL